MIRSTVKTSERALDLITESVSEQQLDVNDGFFKNRSTRCACGETLMIQWRGFNQTQDVLHDVEVAICESCGDDDASGIEVVKSTII